MPKVASVTALEGGFASANLVSPLSANFSKKAHGILAWLADGPHPLRRLTFCVEHVPPEGFKAKLLHTVVERGVSEYDWVPEFLARMGA